MTKSKAKKKRLVILDTHAILHRAYHALPDFATSKGEPTGALYGLITMILKIIIDLRPDFVVAAIDLAGPTYRHEAYEGYKAQREKSEDELISQIKKAQMVLESLSIPVYSAPGFEADDIIGTVVEKTKNDKDLEIIIASGDMDTLQLVEKDRVKVFTLKKGINDTVLYDEKAVIERYSFAPQMVVDYKGLRGDPSDNIIGVSGIGEKTATILITNFGGIEDIYSALEKDKENFIKKSGLTVRIADLLISNKEEAQFSKMLATIRRDAPINFVLPQHKWVEGMDVERARNIFSELEFRTMASRLNDALKKLGKEIEEEKEIAKEESEEDLSEVEVALWLLNSTITNPTREDILAFAKETSVEKAGAKIMKELEERGLDKVFKEIEKPLIPVLRKMEKEGIRIDKETLKELSKNFHKESEALAKKIYELAGEEFNIKSPKQLGVVLFEKMGLKAKNHKKTSTGIMSTKESELEKMKDLHPIIGAILDYRELTKLLSTYIDVIPNLLDEDDRLHTKFLQTGTATGRLSSHEPNIQNIPIRSPLGKEIRKAFIARDGYKLVTADYSQIELRIAAILSGDKNLCDAFKNGEDIHRAVASKVFGVNSNEVTDEMRRRAKIINFGILYGMGVNALRQNLGSDRGEAQAFYDAYFKTFNTLAIYLSNIKEEATKTGFTETLFGRRRTIEGIKSHLPFIRAQAERMAINAPIQGTSADLIKLAMIEIDEYIEKNKLTDDVKMTLQVHDELVFEIKADKVKKIGNQIREIMEGVMPKDKSRGIPLKVEVESGNNWVQTEKI